MPPSAAGVSTAGVRKPSATIDAARHLPAGPGPGTQPPWTQRNTSDLHYQQ